MKKMRILALTLALFTMGTGVSAAPMGMNTHWGQGFSASSYLPMLEELERSCQNFQFLGNYAEV